MDELIKLIVLTHYYIHSFIHCQMYLYNKRSSSVEFTSVNDLQTSPHQTTHTAGILLSREQEAASVSAATLQKKSTGETKVMARIVEVSKQGCSLLFSQPNFLPFTPPDVKVYSTFSNFIERCPSLVVSKAVGLHAAHKAWRWFRA